MWNAQKSIHGLDNSLQLKGREPELTNWRWKSEIPKNQFVGYHSGSRPFNIMKGQEPEWSIIIHVYTPQIEDEELPEMPKNYHKGYSYWNTSIPKLA